METTIIVAIIGAIVSLLTFHGGRALSRSQANSIDAKTLIELSTQVRILHTEFITISNKFDKLEDKVRVMWQYIYALIGQLDKNDITPEQPPVELESDPVLIKLLRKK